MVMIMILRIFLHTLYQVMEFSKPFKYQGITILQKRVITTSYQIA